MQRLQVPCQLQSASWRRLQLARPPASAIPRHGASHRRAVALAAAQAPEATADADDEAAKSDEYSETMSKAMGAALTYRHELGMNFNRILPDLIVGSCLQTPEDVDRLAEEEGVTTVFCLQEDSDMAYFSLDVDPIRKRCDERGDIKHVRFPIRDFDPYDLRRKLPKAVARLSREHSPGNGTVYIHCTAGLGRAPATALAYMNWIRGQQLDEAHALLTGIRRCSPKIDSIRSATADLLLGIQAVEATIAVYRYGDARKIQVAGLDVGWHQMLDMAWDRDTHRFVLTRPLYPGVYQYKLIVDGVWTFSADHPTTKDGDHTNNILEVIAPLDEERRGILVRLLAKGTSLSADEKKQLLQLIAAQDPASPPPAQA